MSITVAVGTINPIDLVSDPETGLKTKYRYPNIRATVTNLTLQPEGLFDQLRDFINLWQHTSDDPPTWVSCPESPIFEAAVKEHYKITADPPDPDDPDAVIFDMGDENGENVSHREIVETNLDVNPDPGAAMIGDEVQSALDAGMAGEG